MDLLNTGIAFDLTLAIRLLSALLLSFAIGLEREMTNKYAGLRTNILVCLGACLFTIISIYGFPEVSVTGDELGTRDTARVAAQVVTGIGFIGAGTDCFRTYNCRNFMGVGCCRYGLRGRNVYFSDCCNCFFNTGSCICQIV